MKILLILANDTKFKDSKRWAETRKKYAYAPTTLTTLASLVPEELNANIQIIDEGVELLNENFYADIVGISTTTSNATRAYKIADKARLKGMTVILGGYHPSFFPDEALLHADAVVIGYAERIWPKLLIDYKNNNLKSIYKDYIDNGYDYFIPTPRRDLLKSDSYMIKSTIEATRGCYNRCQYCVIPGFCKNLIYQRPINEVIDEIKNIKSKIILFLDSSPTENIDYIKELYRALIPLKINWMSSITPKVIYDEEWIQLADKSGCIGVLTGFESLNQTSLANNGRNFNNIKEYKLLIKKLHHHGIALLGCFVFGLDGDDQSIFNRTVQFVNETSIDLVQYAIYTPFPGSFLYYKMKKSKRIISYDWEKYDGKHVVFKPLNMTIDELQNGFYWAWEKTYCYSSIFKRIFSLRKKIFIKLTSNLGFKYLGKTFLPN